MLVLLLKLEVFKLNVSISGRHFKDIQSCKEGYHSFYLNIHVSCFLLLQEIYAEQAVVENNCIGFSLIIIKSQYCIAVKV